MSEGSTVQVLTHFADPDSTGTDHLVDEVLDDGEYRTFCGREFHVNRWNDTFVGDLETANTTEYSRCGNCPWGEYDA